MHGSHDGPHPELKHPIPMHKRVGFLKPLVTAENIEVGDFTYYDDPDGANHAMSGFSTYPFNIFGHGWEDGFDPETWHRELRGDTVLGNDVWIGMEALILPGMNIGHGAIAAAKAVVTHDVPPYAIVAGNPAKVVKTRFDQRTVDRLLKVAWWDWPVDKIGRNLNAIRGADIRALEAAA